MPKKRVNVVPVRLNDDELEVLEMRVLKTGMTRSAIMRKDFLEHPDSRKEMANLRGKSTGQIKGR